MNQTKKARSDIAQGQPVGRRHGRAGSQARHFSVALYAVLLASVPLAGCSAGAGGAEAKTDAANLALKTPPIHVRQTSVLLHQGVPAAEHLYQEALARCRAGSMPVTPLPESVVAKLGHTYLDTWYDGARMATKADRWDFKSADGAAPGCVFEPMHESRLSIIEPGSATVVDLIKGTATREPSKGVRREIAAQDDKQAGADTAQDDEKLRAAVMGELQKQGQGDLMAKTEGESTMAGQPCVRFSSSQGEACVWSGGKKWGFVTDTAASADRMDAPGDNITLSNKPANGEGVQLTTDAMTVGTPIDGKVFAVPANVAIAPAG